MLRKLSDERLTGDLMYSTVLVGQLPQNVFYTEPKLTTAQVRVAYGEPSDQRKDEKGYEVLTYGKLRLISDRTGKVVAVVFPTSW